MKKHTNKIIAGVIIAILLAFIFWYGGDAPGLYGWTSKMEEAVNIVQDNTQEYNATKDEIIDSYKNFQSTQSHTENDIASKVDSDKEYPPDSKMVINETTKKDKHMTDPVPADKPVAIEPDNTVITDKEFTCTLSVRCDTIINNIDWLDINKVSLVPKDGVIFAEKTVSFYEGESVFNLLVREMKQNRIHMEFVNTPIYNSAYIEGINNIYEFDCGELSGWMYKVNGWFPNYGPSRYQLKPGDKVEWVYTCDLGSDVGGNYSTRNGR